MKRFVILLLIGFCLIFQSASAWEIESSGKIKVSYHYDRDKAVEYAKIHAKDYNSDFPNFDPKGGDCTNFASQCLLNGGWSMKKPEQQSENIEELVDYWFLKSQIEYSTTWVRANDLPKFIKESKRGNRLNEDISLKEGKEIPSSWINGLERGDIIQIDYCEHAIPYLNWCVWRGGIDHSMIITGITETEIMVSYHPYPPYPGEEGYVPIKWVIDCKILCVCEEALCGWKDPNAKLYAYHLFDYY